MNINLINSALPTLLRGALVTIQIGALGCAIGITGGTLLGILQTGKNRFIRLLINVYSTIIRGTPMLIQICIIHYVAFPLLGINTSAFTSSVIAIGINSTAYVSQVIRSGISSINKGQTEAASVLGLSNTQTIIYIILPQAIRNVLPSLGNELITLIKDSSLASTIGVYEILKEGSIIISRTYDALTIYCMVALIYLFITSTLSVCVSLIENRMNWYVKD